MRKYFQFIFFLSGVSANAQSIPLNRICLNFSEQHYYDKHSVINDGRPPNDILYPRNAYGKEYIAEYMRTTRCGLLFGAGLIYGIRKYDLNVAYDISNFDPSAIVATKDVVIRSNEQGILKYTGYRVNLGYKKVLNKKWALVAKASFEERLLLKGSRQVLYTHYAYFDDNGYLKAEEIYTIHNHYGKDPNSYRTSLFHFRQTFPLSYGVISAYIGGERSLPPRRFVKSVSLGIEGGRNISMWKSDVMTVDSRQSVATVRIEDISRDTFIDRSIFVGLRVGISFWN